MRLVPWLLVAYCCLPPVAQELLKRAAIKRYKRHWTRAE